MNKRSDVRPDLNLFAVFDAVMDERSLSRAGKRLGITQPAVSHALRRLREMTGGEPLFERTGSGVRPTAHALALSENVRPALDALRATLRQTSEPFDPETSQQVFMIDVPFGIDAILVPELSARLGGSPKIEFRIGNGRARDRLRDLRHGETWLALDHEPAEAADYHSQLLFEDPIVVISRRNHPRISNDPGFQEFEQLNRVEVGWPGKHMIPPGVLRSDKLAQGQIVFSVPTVATLPLVVEKEDYIATITERMARYFARSFSIDIHPLPAPASLPVYMVWHHGFDDHAGHSWMWNVLRDIGAAL